MELLICPLLLAALLASCQASCCDFDNAPHVAMGHLTDSGVNTIVIVEFCLKIALLTLGFALGWNRGQF